MSVNGRCLVLSMNLLNWGVYGAVGAEKVARVCDVVASQRPHVLCLSEIGPGDAIEQLTRPLAQAGVVYNAVSIGYPNQREIRNVVLVRDDVEVLEPQLKVPQEIEVEPIDLDTFQMGGMKLRLSREPLAVLVRVEGHVLAIGFFHPKSKFPEDIRTGKYPKDVPNQTYFGICKMISSLRNFGQCLLARKWVDCFWELNPLKPSWGIAPEALRFVLVGDWNSNPQEEQRLALRGYADAGLSTETLMRDDIGTGSTDLAAICTIPWNGWPNSFDAILVDQKLGEVTEARIFPIEVVDLFGYPDPERDKLENDVLDHRPVGLYLK
ncbi:MAG: hypothetical protein FJX76_23910 [Armatimonadetes bacterium]|nr:hypothetical protein [Armatimonadota bacterium]